MVPVDAGWGRGVTAKRRRLAFLCRLDLAAGRELLELFLPRSGDAAERQCLPVLAAPMDAEHRDCPLPRAAVVDRETSGAVPGCEACDLKAPVVIVEAAEKSGALITARQAAEQGRTVFAVPGPVDSPASAGALGLLREGAILVRRAEDVLEELGGPALAPGPVKQETPAGLTEDQRRVWEFLAEQPRHIDDVARQLGLAVPQVASALMMLEMKKAVRRLPGNVYERRN